MDEKPPMWFQPHQDTLHLNYAGEASYVESDEASFLPIYSPVPRFLHRTYRQSFNISVTADLIHPFKLKKLTECFDESTFSDENSEAYSWDGYLYNLDEMQELGMFLYNVGFPQKLNVAMLAISLHIDIEAARRSGIFGLLGDAPVQMIDVLDIDRLEKFEALFNAHALKKEDEHVQTLFKLCKSSRFFEAIDLWERKAEIAILTTIFHNEIDAGEYTGETVDDHRDWAMENRNIVPELVPKIMVRYCANKCYDKEWLRERSHVS